MSDRLPSWDEVIVRYGLQLKSQGGQLRGPCPLHRGHNVTSFVVTPGRGFYCHACGLGGGIATFIDLMEDPDRATRGASHPWGRLQGRQDTPVRLDLDRYAEGRFHTLASLPDVPAIGPLDPRHPYLRQRGITPETARRFGCGYLAGVGVFSGRIVFPIHTPDGRIVGHVGRAVSDGVEPRYRFQQGVRRALLLLHEHGTTPMEPVVVVEGPFDAMAVSQVGVANVVALLGCRATGHQLAPLAWFPRVVVLLDADDAGELGARWICAQLGARAVIAHVPGDPASTDRATLARVLDAAGAVRMVTTE